ncbi:MAG: FAD-dependent oxidoreductase, partial [Bacteroidota bacterium]
MEWRVMKSFFKMNMFSSISDEISSKFKHPKLRELLEFPVLFLGAKPEKTPALYSLMNYADIKLGTWYPMGGMAEIPKAMGRIASELGVKFRLGEEVQKLSIKGRKVTHVETTQKAYEADHYISSADYHHTETVLLPRAKRNYTDRYWSSRVMAPSSLLFYLGLDRKVEGLLH